MLFIVMFGFGIVLAIASIGVPLRSNGEHAFAAAGFLLIFAVIIGGVGAAGIWYPNWASGS